MRTLLVIQGMYYFVTGTWPLVSIQSFEAVTGPKKDDWLVQTVGVLALVIGLCLLYGCRRFAPVGESLMLAALAAVGFITVDLVFVLHGVISPVYLADAAVQSLLLGAIGLAYLYRTQSCDRQSVREWNCPYGRRF